MSDCVAPDAFVRGRAGSAMDGSRGIMDFAGRPRRFPFAWLRVGVAVGGPMGPPLHKQDVTVVILIT